MSLAILTVQPSHRCAETAGRAEGSSAAETKSEQVQLSAGIQHPAGKTTHISSITH